MTYPTFDPQWLQVAETAARAAGRIALDYRGRVEIRSKGLRDLVTEADELCQAEIKRILAAAFPDHAFLAEEKDDQPDRASDFRWIIDPIDGTSNYSYGLPIFCTSIALTYQNQPLVGVVYDPLRDDLFAAGRGQGATLNRTPLRVSQRSELIEAMIGLEWASRPDRRAETLRRLLVVGDKCLTVRSPGAAALSLCYVAAGMFDAYFDVHLAPWDVAAGALLIQEAGGQVTTLDGSPWSLGFGGVLATNGRVHRALLETWGRDA